MVVIDRAEERETREKRSAEHGFLRAAAAHGCDRLPRTRASDARRRRGFLLGTPLGWGKQKRALRRRQDPAGEPQLAELELPQYLFPGMTCSKRSPDGANRKGPPTLFCPPERRGSTRDRRRSSCAHVSRAVMVMRVQTLSRANALCEWLEPGGRRCQDTAAAAAAQSPHHAFGSRYRVVAHPHRASVGPALLLSDPSVRTLVLTKPDQQEPRAERGARANFGDHARDDMMMRCGGGRGCATTRRLIGPAPIALAGKPRGIGRRSEASRN